MRDQSQVRPHINGVNFDELLHLLEMMLFVEMHSRRRLMMKPLSAGETLVFRRIMTTPQMLNDVGFPFEQFVALRTLDGRLVVNFTV